MSDLDKKVILITGAGRGSGRSLCLSLAARGASVAANDLSPLNVDEVVRQVSASGRGQARAYLHDVAKKVAVQAQVNQVQDDFGRIDILINNANVQHPAGLLNMDEWDLHRVFEVNTIGAFLAMQAVGRVMREQGGGLVINLLGDLQNSGQPLPPAYLASRLAVAGLTRQAAAELALHNIRVYGLACGLDELCLPDPVFSSIEQAILALLDAPDIPSGSLLKVCER
jgi:3-oxoacyl-[acyl-carrier protein] reductase